MHQQESGPRESRTLREVGRSEQEIKGLGRLGPAISQDGSGEASRRRAARRDWRLAELWGGVARIGVSLAFREMRTRKRRCLLRFAAVSPFNKGSQTSFSALFRVVSAYLSKSCDEADYQ
jgi:hypothetical protein